MATKKRGGDGGGSNLGLIITLVFFVLTTVLLGVTTYLAYTENDAKDKAKKTAEDDKAKSDQAMKWHRFKAYLLQSYMGFPSAREEAKDVPNLKKGLDNDSSVYKSQPDYGEFRTLVVSNLGKVMPWNAATMEAPSKTFSSRLADKDVEIKSLRGAVAAAATSLADEKRRADAARKDADDSALAFKKKLKEQADKDEAQRAADVKQLEATIASLTRANEEKNAVAKGTAAVQAEMAKIKKERDNFAGQLATARREKTDLQAAYEEKTAELSLYKDRSSIDPSEIESRRLDASALEAIRNWDLKRKSWQITSMDRTGRMPYVNLGSSDKLQPHVTFSIHSMGRDGRLNPVPKGTLEIVSIKGPRTAQARITSMAKGAEKDPILKGDYLFNPTWDPNSRKRIVLAGLADLNEDHTDATKVLRQLLERQEVDVVGYIDATDPREMPKMVGKGVTTKTDYVVLGDSLEDVNHPRAREREFAEAYKRLIRRQRDNAANAAVPVITLRKYLDMIGYRAPKLSTSGRTIR